MEKIEVGYTPAAFVGGFGIYHKYILYTNSAGQQFYVRGGPGFFGPGAEDGGLTESSTSPFGNIKTRTGVYDDQSVDWDPSRDPVNPDVNATPHPRETIIEGDDLSFDWQNIRDVMTDIDNRNIGYDPKDTNSNASVDEALRRSGLPAPTKDGPSDNWAPGSDFDMPGGDVAPGGRGFGDELGDWLWDKSGLDDLSDAISDLFDRARNWIPRCEPLVLDLDGDGIETIGANGTVLFDHDGDGTRHSTGWTKADDGIVVLDRNGNGTIDNGGELFGVETVLSNGTKAADGFTALADLDTNQDGVFDASDAQYAHVRIWRDFNQNGLSEAGELKSLSESNVASISLAAEAASTTLSNGNRIIATGTYTRLDGTERAAADLDFATGRFWREFPDTIALVDAARSLVDIRGSGAVRDLRDAANDWVWERMA